MGKPRLLILIRHGQSEGNRNRNIHQFIADHRISLTPEGWLQSEDAGRRLKAMLRKDDTIRFFTSPYRRTRETTEGILRTLTADDETGSSPFQRDDIKVYEEPRLREQDFGNFQPCSTEMERMWQERADYGHFFYRIPNGESAADAYDRISGFNESLWRQFGDDTFPSVCILVTHGLMTRVFVMKWFKYSVEFFEDLRNLRHCEFVIMELNEQFKYELKSTLRTWSELQQGDGNDKDDGNPRPATPPPARRWGGCVNGCNHKLNFPRRMKRVNTVESLQVVGSTEYDDHPIACQDLLQNSVGELPARTTSVKMLSAKTVLHDFELNPADGGVALPHVHELLSVDDDQDQDDGQDDDGDDRDDQGEDDDDDEDEEEDDEIDAAHRQLHREPVDEDNDNNGGLSLAPYRRHHNHSRHHRMASDKALRAGRDGGGSTSGVASPAGLSDDGDYFGGDGGPGGVAVGQQQRSPRVTFRADDLRSTTHAVVKEEAALLDGKAASLAAAKVKEEHACTACGRPFDHQEALADPAVSADAGALDTPGEEGTVRWDVY